MKDRIKEIRKTLNLTQQEFADRLGIKRGGIANYEIGRNDPSDSVISLICREFNVNEQWLRYGNGDMFILNPDMDFLARKYHLSKDMCDLVERIATLSPKQQDVVINFIMETANLLANQRAATPVTPVQQHTDPDIEAKVADYSWN